MIIKLPDEVIQAWGKREGPLVLTTVNKKGQPNSIYATIVELTKDGRIAIADNYFDKTKANINAKCKVCALFISKERKAYQIKGTIDYSSNGPHYEEMLLWADPKHPRKGVAVLNTEEVFRGSDKLV
jgi:predicted pyridoxine 5'-phosphate oxidase superfamily flavin-nucleotide-binding protein